MKSPKKLRSDILFLSEHIDQVRHLLIGRSDERLAQIGKECLRAANSLGELLKSQTLPANYKVAVVGRFKAGKSSFVNELLGARLAGEDTSPETAAITTFKHGSRVEATVSFVSKEVWVDLQRLFSDDAKHIDAHRVKNWKSFASKQQKGSLGQTPVSFDLPALEAQFVKPGGFSITIDLPVGDPKKSENEFRRRLKEFTSSSKPHHCLVEKIEITSPAEILDQGVLLIDTPGLDDTERFRVSLTEKVVEDVDAVLFLTKSGGSYGQSEKDFLLTLLRKGTVKQLIVVITQVDQTYEQHIRAVDDGEEDLEHMDLRIAKERERITAEITATLNDLSVDDTPAMRRYREQLGDVGLAFTSAAMHRDWKAKREVPYPIHEADPGGVNSLKTQLLHLLSTESRLALTAQHISISAKDILLDLQETLHKKLLALRNIKDKEVAEKKLATFRDEFGEAGERFKGSIEQQVKFLKDRLAEKERMQLLIIDNIGHLSKEQFNDFELNDVGRHWRTRRSGYWGYMHGLQQRVANRIFPKVQEMLGEQTSVFARFTHDFEVFLNKLSQEGAAISEHLELGTVLPFDVTVKLKDSLEKTLVRANELIAGEELSVVSLLDDFVTDEVSEKISAQRDRVASIFGQGTTVAQAREVRAFYSDVKQLLQEALEVHLRKRCKTFSEFLTLEAEAAPRDALNEVHLLLEQAADNIRAAAAAQVIGQKELAEALTQSIEGEIAPVIEDCTNLFASTHTEEITSAVEQMSVTSETDSVEAASGVARSDMDLLGDDDGDWFVNIQRQATTAIKRFHLRDGEVGWPLDRIFLAQFMVGAERVVIIDPYLAAHHQIRNLNELLLQVAETAKPREILIITSFAHPDSASYQQKVLDNTAKDLFKNFGVTLTVQREATLHDRYVILDSGVLFKLGRGLDFYKPATGLAMHRQGSRRVRQTEIDVFVLENHPLTKDGQSDSIE